MLDLYVEGLAEPLGTTANHPFFSADEQRFKRADELRPGERLQSLAGTPQVVRIERRPASQPVYNLEVQVDHVYHVGSCGLLVHNGTGRCPTWRFLNGTVENPVQLTGPMSGRTKLYRAIGAEELDDVVREGNYGLNPHGSGKYFFFNEEDMRRFVASPDNAHVVALTEVELPDSVIREGFEVNAFGEGQAIHFTDEQLLEIYDGMDLPRILDSQGFPILGGEG